jgi:hypothetical protein
MAQVHAHAFPCFVFLFLLPTSPSQLGEENAFTVLRRLLYGWQLRHQYKANMEGLHRNLYIFTRLLQDRLPTLYASLESNGVDAFMYATPWFLTFFASQFPLRFAQRVLGNSCASPKRCAPSNTLVASCCFVASFAMNSWCEVMIVTFSFPYVSLLIDFVLAQGSLALFKFSIALMMMAEHDLLETSSFESQAQYLNRTVLSLVDDIQGIVVRVSSLDITDAQLDAYGYEFNNLRDNPVTFAIDNPSFQSRAESDPLVRQLHEMLIAKQRELNEAKAENDSLKQQVNHAKTSLQMLRLEAESHQTTVAHLMQTNAALQEAYSARKEDNIRLRSELREMRAFSRSSTLTRESEADSSSTSLPSYP